MYHRLRPVPSWAWLCVLVTHDRPMVLGLHRVERVHGLDVGGSMKATQVKPTQQKEKTIVCDICGKHVVYAYGYTRRGNGCVCSKTCQEKYDEVCKVRFGC